MNDDTPSALTHEDLAREVGVSVTTIKSYRRKFPGFIPVLGFGKPIRFTPVALDVALKIRECFNEGLNVRETRKRLLNSGFTQDKASIPPPIGAGPASSERMDEFVRAAGLMMQSVGKLAEAQKNTDQRLSRLEQGMEQLARAQAENQVLLTKLTGSVPVSTTGEDVLIEPTSARVLAKKIVNVRSRQGTVDSYALEKAPGEPQASTWSDAPPPALLDVPVAIRTSDDAYLGLPGRRTLRELAAGLVDQGRLQGNMLASWHPDGADWLYKLIYPDDHTRSLGFAAQTSPTGMQLAVLTTLVVDGREATPEERMEYFREIKDYQNQR
ncbi:MAG: helix-turn-helix domain-containing protein [Proteobacteria bacterium]|nr:helix-turn-helix domain-containing protein [Pseudomonadota bacterium]MBU1612638.1 helix-turn-helix domain-containing protein [Pseudomonadota bacterium]